MSDGDPGFHLRARAVSEELFRVLSDEQTIRGSGALEPVLMSFVGRPDALEFLRTVPTATSRTELERLGAAYCAAHPAPLVTEENESRDP